MGFNKMNWSIFISTRLKYFIRTKKKVERIKSFLSVNLLMRLTALKKIDIYGWLNTHLVCVNRAGVKYRRHIHFSQIDNFFRGFVKKKKLPKRTTTKPINSHFLNEDWIVGGGNKKLIFHIFNKTLEFDRLNC